MPRSRGVCLDPIPLALAILVPPPEDDRHVAHVWNFCYRSASVFDVLVSIGSGAPFTTLILAAFVVLFGFHTRTWMEMEAENTSSYQGEPMLVDGSLEQGLPFPLVVSQGGQHSVQCIDMWVS